MGSVRSKLGGSFELMLLFSRGLLKFSGSREDALKSILLPVLLFPFTIWFALVYHPKGMEEGYGDAAIVAVVTAQFLISYIFTVVAVAAVANWLKRRDKFWLFLEASNWTAAAAGLVSIPFILMAVFGIFPREEMDRILAIITIYGYVVTACIAWRSLDLNWQLAGAISILTLFITQETWHLLYLMMGIPIPW